MKAKSIVLRREPLDPFDFCPAGKARLLRSPRLLLGGPGRPLHIGSCPMTAPDALVGFLAGRNYSALIKQLDSALSEAPAGDHGARRQLLLNRGFCLHQLGLYRKALKVNGMPRDVGRDQLALSFVRCHEHFPGGRPRDGISHLPAAAATRATTWCCRGPQPKTVCPTPWLLGTL